MADDESPRPFRRERNLSNRNFNKRGSRRRFSTESHSSVDSLSTSNSVSGSGTPAADSQANNNSSSASVRTSGGGGGSGSSSSSGGGATASSSLQYSYSVNSDTENAFNLKSLRKMVPLMVEPVATVPEQEEPQTPDPALLGVKQKVLRFERVVQCDQHLLTKTKYKSRSLLSLLANPKPDGAVQLGPLRVLPVRPKRTKQLQLQQQRLSDSTESSSKPSAATTSSGSTSQTSRSELRSEDEVDDFSDYEADDDNKVPPGVMAGEYVVPEEAQEMQEHMLTSPGSGAGEVNADALELSIDDFGKVEALTRSVSVNSTSVYLIKHSSEPKMAVGMASRKDFPRNYRTTPRPKTEVIGTSNRHVVGKFNSLYQPVENEDDAAQTGEVEEEEIELRNKSGKFVQPILDELIKTEESYVENLLIGIKNYGNIFTRKDLPIGLRGKKYVLLGNIEQLAEFHRDEFLPMLQRNCRDLKRLFDEFQLFIEQNCFYGYVIYTMNKQRSLKLCDTYKNYFKLIQSELDDKLGINSFLVQPIQRMARYPLLLQQFISTLFKNRDFVMKPLIESCCRVEKKMRILLTTTNESEVINDIVDCNEFNVFYQGKFRKVSEYNVYDHTLKRSYRSKVFIFDKCIIYTEIKGKSLVFHGRYPCEHVGILAKTKSFTLFYERRRQQECDFHGEPTQIETWLELIRDMINSFVTEERQKLHELYSRENDHLHRKPPSLSLFRDSNRFSSDSGIGNIWVLPKPEAEEVAATASNRTTWYTTA